MGVRCPECPVKFPARIELAQERVIPQRTRGGVISRLVPVGGDRETTRRVPVGNRDFGVNTTIVKGYLLQLKLEPVKHFPVPWQEVRGSMYALGEVLRVDLSVSLDDAGLFQRVERTNEVLFLIIRHALVVLPEEAHIIPSHRTRLRAGSARPYLGSR